MPSPIGHVLAGTAIAWVAGPSRCLRPSRRQALTLTLLCGALAAIPDADLLLPIGHRGPSHSVTAVALVTIVIVASVVTGRVTRGVRWRLVMACAAAYASHLALDWLGSDTYDPRGIQVFWPFSDTFFISDLDLFFRIERRDVFSPETIRTNLRAGVFEVLSLGPVVLLAWTVRRVLWKKRETQEYT